MLMKTGTAVTAVSVALVGLFFGYPIVNKGVPGPCGALERRALDSIQSWARDNLGALGASAVASLQNMSGAKLNPDAVRNVYPGLPLPVGCAAAYWNSTMTGEISRDLVTGIDLQTEE